MYRVFTEAVPHTMQLCPTRATLEHGSPKAKEASPVAETIRNPACRPVFSKFPALKLRCHNCDPNIKALAERMVDSSELYDSSSSFFGLGKPRWPRSDSTRPGFRVLGC